MIKSIDQLQLKLLDLSETERLKRHAQLEIAFAEQTDKSNMLTEALKKSQQENAGLRLDMQRILEQHKDKVRAE